VKSERRRIVFSGRVQGVGFRMTTVQISRDLALDGTVRNQEDGAVELLVDGPAAEIDRLVSRLREHFGAFVRNVQQTTLNGTTSGPTATHAGIRVIS
jgi:acylphosphatase